MIVQSSQIVPLFDSSSFNTVGTPGSKDHLVELVKRNISYLGKIAFASKTKQVRTQALRRLQAAHPHHGRELGCLVPTTAGGDRESGSEFHRARSRTGLDWIPDLGCIKAKFCKQVFV